MSVFTDEVEITVQSGNGGDGIISFRREKYVPRGGPDGGDGGAGGDIVFVVDRRVRSLYNLKVKKIFKAENGKPGEKKNKTGARGKDCVIIVPPGTIIKDKNSLNILGDLKTDGQKLVLLKGGRGGYGNAHFVSPTNRAPRICKPGGKGKKVELILQLKMIANVGLVGLPNVGKSTLLSVLTKAKPKIGNYPFTTLHPNLGVMHYNKTKQIVLADIPGLIEGAHEGHGLGIKFLKHLERTSVLLFVLDLSEGNFKKNYETLQKELNSYSTVLGSKERLIVGNKMDIVGQKEKELFKSDFSDYNAIMVSAITGEGIKNLKDRIAILLESFYESKIS